MSAGANLFREGPVSIRAPSGSARLRQTRLSCEKLLRFPQGRNKPIHLFARIVKSEGGPTGRSRAETRQQRHGAVGAGANRDASAVDHGCDVMGMGALHLE